MITIERKKLEQWLEALESDYTFEWPAMHRPERAEKKRFEAITAIKAALAQPAQEPMAYLPPTPSPENALYTPPQRTWVGLTDEQKNEITWGKTVYEILELAEAKLKELNHD
jgi:hypothetical protein